MSEDVDPEVLARRYLDLWQDQMTALSADPEFAETLSQLMKTMGLAGTEWATAWANWPEIMAKGSPLMRPDSERGDDSTGQAAQQRPRKGKSESAAPGAEALGSASDHGKLDLGQLADRLAALEERLDRLERPPRRKRKAAPRKSGSGSR